MPTLMVCRHTGNPLHIKPKPLFNWSELSGRASKSIDFMLMFFVSLLLQVTKSCSQIPKISCERCVGGHFKDWKGQDEGWSMLYNCTFFCFPTCAFIVNNNYIWTCICYNIFLPKMHNHCNCMCYNTTQQKKHLFWHKKNWIRSKTQKLQPYVPMDLAALLFWVLTSSRRFCFFGQKTKNIWSNHKIIP